MDTYFDENGKEHKKPDKIQPTRRISGYALIEQSGKMLMVQPTLNNRWELPGGGIEIQESIREGIQRECYEETGYRVETSKQPIYVEESNFYCTELDKYFKSIILIYTGKLMSKKQHKEVINTVEKDEIEEVAWVPVRTLHQANTRPIVWPVISRLLQKG